MAALSDLEVFVAFGPPRSVFDGCEDFLPLIWISDLPERSHQPKPLSDFFFIFRLGWVHKNSLRKRNFVMPDDDFDDLCDALSSCLSRARNLKADTLEYLIEMAVLEVSVLRNRNGEAADLTRLA